MDLTRAGHECTMMPMPTYLEIEVSLMHIKPRIWRRFLIDTNHTFEDLNNVIQFVGPWDHSHLWHFRHWGRRGEIFAELKYPGMEEDPFGWGDEPVPNAADVLVASVLKNKGDRCLYLYDMGDNWEHEVKLRNLVQSDEKIVRRLLAGERNFPQEDCGGVHGYHMNLLALGKIPWDGSEGDYKPSKRDLQERREWIGNWDPEAFDLEAVKADFDRPRIRAAKADAPKPRTRKAKPKQD
jgi:hypothetical protein